MTYNYLFSTIKASLCSDSINSFELKLNCVFPAATRFLCTKYLKDGTPAYLQKEVGVPQKDRKAMFGEKSLVKADDSISSDKRSKDVHLKASKYPKFSQYFNRKLKPYIQLYVNQPSRTAKISDWTNNNCESLNSMMKRDDNWKVKSTQELIDMLNEVTLLHFKDFRGALYGEGNYRIRGKHKKYIITKSAWSNLDTEGRQRKFAEFLQNKRSACKDRVVTSIFCKFTVHRY